MVLVVKAEAQMLHMVVEAVAQVIRYELRHRFAHVGLEVGKRAADDAKPDDNAGNNQKVLQRKCAAFRQNLDLVYGYAEVVGQKQICGCGAEH